MAGWDLDQAREMYRIRHWSSGYFEINQAGRVIAVSRRHPKHPGIDLAGLAQEVEEAGLALPVLARFLDVLHDRIDNLTEAFDAARKSEGYRGQYKPVYPIKVNQQRSVVGEILKAGAGRVGLEAGSKPELLISLAMAPADGGLIICNGYKDREYVRLALIGQHLGMRPHIVIEKLSEVDIVLEESRKLGLEPLLGLRLRLATIGVGKWQNTGGEKSKFGVTALQALEVVDRLRAAGVDHRLQLLHFHLGSQIANVRDIQRGMREIARTYAELRKLGIPLSIVDVGGGLGIDYEGLRSRSSCSMNYTIEEYANNVVHALMEICDEHDLPHPEIVTESGRAMTAHHAVLITNVTDFDPTPAPKNLPAPAEDAHHILHDLWDGLKQVAKRSPLEAYHDALHWLSEVHAMYNHGVLGLKERAWAEEVYYSICLAVQSQLAGGARTQRDVFDDLNEKFADKYFCNFSLFQSMPDVWAIDQIFPIMPLHRLDEEPLRRGIIQDLTCDSDGHIEFYVHGEGIEPSLPLHEPKSGERYLIGMFLVGAYQEILGDLHNLFGDTAAVNVTFTEDGHRLSEPEAGDTVTDVLQQVNIRREDLITAYRQKMQRRTDLMPEVRSAALRELEAGLLGYTYLED